MDRRVLGFPHWDDADKEQSWRDLGINKVDEPDILPLVLRTGCVAILFIVYYGEPGQFLMQNAAKLKVLAMLIIFYSLPATSVRFGTGHAFVPFNRLGEVFPCRVGEG